MPTPSGDPWVRSSIFPGAGSGFMSFTSFEPSLFGFGLNLTGSFIPDTV